MTLTLCTAFLFTASAMAENGGDVAAKGKDGKKCEKCGKKGGNGKRRAKILKRFDKNGDGKLDKSEKAAAKAMRAKKIKKFDTDGDGKLSKTERQAAKAARKAKRQNK